MAKAGSREETKMNRKGRGRKNDVVQSSDGQEECI